MIKITIKQLSRKIISVILSIFIALLFLDKQKIPLLIFLKEWGIGISAEYMVTDDKSWT